MRRLKSWSSHNVHDNSPAQHRGDAGCAAGVETDIASALALIEDQPSPINATMMADIQRELRAGNTVLLLATSRAVRDQAKRDIIAMAGPGRGTV